MKIYLHEITDQEMEMDFSQEDQWVSDAVLKVDERPSEEISPSPKKRPIQTHFQLRKVDDVIVVSGKIETHIKLICSRCANAFQVLCDLQFSGLFCKDPVMAGVAHLQKPEDDHRAPGRPARAERSDAAEDRGVPRVGRRADVQEH